MDWCLRWKSFPNGPGNERWDAPGEEGRWSAARGGLRWCWRHRPHIAGGRAAYAEEKAAPCVFARPQQKSDPTEVNENNGVDLLPPEVCAEPVREKGTAKGKKCDRKTQRTVHL